jgi:hypothetical protein
MKIFIDAGFENSRSFFDEISRHLLCYAVSAGEHA